MKRVTMRTYRSEADRKECITFEIGYEILGMARPLLVRELNKALDGHEPINALEHIQEILETEMRLGTMKAEALAANLSNGKEGK